MLTSTRHKNDSFRRKATMRDILFRGKNLLDKWIVGDLLQYLGWEKKHIVQHYSGAGGQEVIPSTIGQYTGLKDKNGTRIFEGDIVLIKGDDEPYQVAFDECCFQVYDSSVCYTMDNFYDYDIEVIGNVYDNPELLKESEQA